MKSPIGTKLLILICLLTTCFLERSCSSDEVEPKFGDQGVDSLRRGTVGREDEILLCGESRPVAMPDIKLDYSAKIIKGQDALPGEFPYQAYIRPFQAPDQLFCGAVLISSRFVLTAAHCVVNSTVDYVRLGATNRLRTDAIWIPISKHIAHPLYEPASYMNDIAILKLAKPVHYSLMEAGHGSINRICLPGQPDGTIEGAPVIATGWGNRKGLKFRQVEILQKVNLVVVEHSTCVEKYRQINDFLPLDERLQICAGDWNYARGTCKGDSGGPLIRVLKDGRHELLGLSSFTGHDNCSKADGVPDGFTRVSHYLDWIIDTASSLESD